MSKIAPIRFRIRGRRRAEIAKHVEPIGVFVRSAQTGKVVFATGSEIHGLKFEMGEFSLDVQLRMNVQPGIYLIDVGVFDRADEKALFSGPSLNVRVTEGRIFGGEINLNSEMQLDALPLGGVDSPSLMMHAGAPLAGGQGEREL